MGRVPWPLLGAVSNRHPWGAPLAALGSPRLSEPGRAVGQVPLLGDCQVCWALNRGLLGCYHPLPVLTMARVGSCVVVYPVMGKEREPEEGKPVLSSRNYRQTAGGLFTREFGETHVLPSIPSPDLPQIKTHSCWEPSDGDDRNYRGDFPCCSLRDASMNANQFSLIKSVSFYLTVAPIC